MAERILVLGSTGTTGSLLVEQLRGRGVEVAAATRKPSDRGQVRFDWSDRATFPTALDAVDAAYVVAPTDRAVQLPIMRPFLEQAVERLPGPIVLLSAAALPADGPMMGAVHGWLRDNAPRWAALRPSWFMQNFTRGQLPTIRSEGCVYSATEDGRIPFIDADDIAAVAAVALLAPERASGDLVLTGPASLTYDDVAAMIGGLIRRRVRHCRISVDALSDRYRAFGLPPDYSDLLAGMDEAIARGAEDRITDDVRKVTGRPPTSLAAFLSENRQCFL